MFKFDLQLFKKGSQTTVQSYKPTEQEVRLQKQAADYADAVSPNALNLNNVAGNLLNGSYGTVQADYNQLNQNAQNQITGAQNTVSNLSSGVLPEAYQQNMTDAINKTVQNTVGKSINGLGSRGVLNSSVTNQALNDASTAAADATAQNYINNIGVLNGLAGQQATLANQGIATTAAAQEAAQAPALALWNASLGLNNGSTLGLLNSIAGQGTTTSTVNNSGSGLLGGVLTGLAGNSSLFCFVGDTKIKTPSGDKQISLLKAGHKVICPNDNGIDTEETATDVMEPHYANVYTVVCDGGSFVNTTLSQPLMADDGSFVLVSDIQLGTTKLKGKGLVRSLIFSGERKVYDLKVTGSNRYYADGFIAQGGTTEWGEQ